MCYNCGCEEKDNPMGKGFVSETGGSLTEKDFEYMAEKWGMTLEESKKNVLKLLEKEQIEAAK